MDHLRWLLAPLEGRVKLKTSKAFCLSRPTPGLAVAGTSRLARRLTTILPAMTLAEAIETTRIHRVAGITGDRTAFVTTRPCRTLHHTISDARLIGGGHVRMPGEVSLAHNGVLFLDEWPEFRRHVLEVLPIRLRRASHKYNLASIADFVALAVLAARVKGPRTASITLTG
jgi:magnesium chelatase family protein